MPPFSPAQDPVVVGNHRCTPTVGENFDEDEPLIQSMLRFGGCGVDDGLLSSIFCSTPPAVLTSDNCHEWRIEHAKTYETVMKELRECVHSRNVIARMVRHAVERRREKALKTREVSSPLENKKALKTREVSFPLENEKKMNKSAKKFSFFSRKQKTKRNSNTPNNEELEVVLEKKAKKSVKMFSLLTTKRANASKSKANYLATVESEDGKQDNITEEVKSSVQSENRSKQDNVSEDAKSVASDHSKDVTEQHAISEEAKPDGTKQDGILQDAKFVASDQSEDSKKQHDTSIPSENKTPSTVSGRFTMESEAKQREVKPIGMPSRACSMRVDLTDRTSALNKISVNKLSKKNLLRNPFRGRVYHI
jgi:hypothetical protein